MSHTNAGAPVRVDTLLCFQQLLNYTTSENFCQVLFKV